MFTLIVYLIVAFAAFDIQWVMNVGDWNIPSRLVLIIISMAAVALDVEFAIERIKKFNRLRGDKHYSQKSPD